MLLLTQVLRRYLDIESCWPKDFLTSYRWLFQKHIIAPVTLLRLHNEKPPATGEDLRTLSLYIFLLIVGRNKDSALTTQGSILPILVKVSQHTFGPFPDDQWSHYIETSQLIWRVQHLDIFIWWKIWLLMG